ncbi:hypothetical protein C367_05533 [Cryptococcus neoformans Ze90-1]|nr:hypothetical protein C367_05533 [Cryptococcus neoformans var. grubii Ze90-1]
MFHLSRDVL